ncbi:MAG: hypothetical protein ACR2L9_00890 [Solirubrobacteraceae bacterium]
MPEEERNGAPVLKRIVVGLVTIGVMVGLVAVAAGAPRALQPRPVAADCQPFEAVPCLLPFPNDLFTRRDRHTPTGLRVHLPEGAMPVNKSGQRIAVADYDRADGFSPGSDVIVHVPGLDNAAAFAKTRPVGITDMSRTFGANQPIVIIDERTGARQLIWAELDANAPTPQATDLLIHPGKDFAEGHTYVVALRNLRDSRGHLIPAPGWFQRLRDGRKLLPAERSQRGRYLRIFTALRRTGVSKHHLYEAWDFTVASRQSTTSRMLAIRNDAFHQLGDTNLGDVKVQGRAPAYTITSVDTIQPGVRRVQGTVEVPCYLRTCGASATTGFHYGSRKPDASPSQLPGNVASAPFECVIPSSAGNPAPARISLYGHGLLGDRTEVEAGDVVAMATEHNFVFCATDWWGLASGDVGFDVTALQNLNLFGSVVDRLQQGVLNTLFLGRLMLNPSGLAANPAFQVGGHPAIDTSALYYDGNSQGGIMGGMTTAVAPDFRRAALGVPGMNYGGMLLQRSTDFSAYEPFLYGSYADPSLHPLILDLMQQLWDRGEADGYAEQMTNHPPPDTPSHVVLMQVAYGDHQVSMYAAAVEARTIGAHAYQPALDLATNRARDRNLLYGIPAIPSYPFHGSAIVIWDSGPGRVQPPPLANIAPANSPSNIDPHPDPRNTPAARVQKSDFLTGNGAVLDVCGHQPCRTSVYAP